MGIDWLSFKKPIIGRKKKDKINIRSEICIDLFSQVCCQLIVTFVKIEIHLQMYVTSSNLWVCVDFPAPKPSQHLGNDVILLSTRFNHLIYKTGRHFHAT